MYNVMITCLMRDEKEERSKQGQTNNKAKQHSMYVFSNVLQAKIIYFVLVDGPFQIVCRRTTVAEFKAQRNIY